MNEKKDRRAMVKCPKCHQGRIQRGGFVYVNCHECKGKGFTLQANHQVVAHQNLSSKMPVENSQVDSNSAVCDTKTYHVKLDKRSKVYRDAIEKIQKCDKNITKSQAKALFDQQYQTLE